MRQHRYKVQYAGPSHSEKLKCNPEGIQPGCREIIYEVIKSLFAGTPQPAIETCDCDRHRGVHFNWSDMAVCAGARTGSPIACDACNRGHRDDSDDSGGTGPEDS